MIHHPSSYNLRGSFFGLAAAGLVALLARSSSTALNNMMLSPPSFVKPNSIKAEWIVDQSSNNAPEHASMTPPRSGHVGWVTSNTNDIYIFGGYAEEWIDSKTPNRYVKNDLWKCSSSSSQENISWIDMSSKQKGDVPQTRLASACSILTHDTNDSTKDNSSSSLLLIGGWDPQSAGTGGVILDDIHELNLSTLQWTKLPITVPDGPTSRHVAVTIRHCSDDTDEHDSTEKKKQQQSILIHNHRCTDHVLLLSKQENDGEWSIRTQSTSTGSSASPRGLHVAQTFDSGSKVLIFGGAAQSGQMTNDVYVLDCNTWKWTQVKCGSLVNNSVDNNDDASVGLPLPRASPCLLTLHDESSPIITSNDGNNYHRFVLFGGAGRTPEGGLMGLNDTWLFHLVMHDGENNNNNKGNAVITGWWEKLDTSMSTDKSPSPPGRNAATMFPLASSTAGESDSSCRSFLLQGGWTPFVKTYNDNCILKLSPSAK